MGEVTNIFKVTRIIAANCAHFQQTVKEQCLPDGQVYTFTLCAELCTTLNYFEPVVCLYGTALQVQNYAAKHRPSTRQKYL